MFVIVVCAAAAVAILIYMLMSTRRGATSGSRVRRFPRLEVTMPVEIHTHAATHAAESRNISSGGMSLRGTAPVCVAQPVQLSFILPEQVAVTIPAVVTHRQGEQIGVRFDPTHYRHHAIDKWIKETIAQAAEAQAEKENAEK